MSKKSPPSPTVSSVHSTSLSPVRSTSPPSSYIEIPPPNPTRRPPPNNPHSIQSPPPPEDAAPDYNSIGPPNIMFPNGPPGITEDCSPPWYTWGNDSHLNSPAPPLFSAIFAENEFEIRRLIAQNPNIVNTKDGKGRTPLYCATAAYKRNIAIVRLLLEAGAEVNEWSTEYRDPQHRSRPRINGYKNPKHTIRTPLMAACKRGHLPIARLLIAPPYNADPRLVAPDGQHALRLASASGSREIVALLPSLRAGGWKRFKHHTRPHIDTIKRTGKRMYAVSKFFTWDVPKFLLWTTPKYLSVSLWKLLKWIGRELWTSTKAFAGWLTTVPGKVYRFITWFPGAMRRLLVAVVRGIIRGIKKAPGVLGRFFGRLWKFLSVTLPKFVVDVLKFCWELLTVDIPHAISATTKFLWDIFTAIVKWVWNIITVRLPKVLDMVFKAVVDGAKKMGEYVVDILSTIASVLHTFFSFILRKCTWENVVQGITRTFQFLMGLPAAVWDGVEAVYKLCCKVIEGLFGCLGWIFVALTECLIICIMWFPKMIGKVLVSCGKIVGDGWNEVRVWIDPKAEV